MNIKLLAPSQQLVIFVGNVLKEICEPEGALIKAGQFDLGDPTLNLLEIWGAEYQESNAILIQPKDTCTLQKLGRREKCPVNFVGYITGTGKVGLSNFSCANCWKD